jgi:hypothetical protein
MFMIYVLLDIVGDGVGREGVERVVVWVVDEVMGGQLTEERGKWLWV